MAIFNCMKTCGVNPFVCKNIHCSGNPNYRPPKAKVKTKQGAGKPPRSARSKIKKDDGSGFGFDFRDN